MAERGSQLPGVGLPAGAPERPASTAAYPAVHDMPPTREAPLLKKSEQRQIEDDLMAARTRNQRIGGQPVTPTVESKPSGGNAPARRPSTSRGSIY